MMRGSLGDLNNIMALTVGASNDGMMDLGDGIHNHMLDH